MAIKSLVMFTASSSNAFSNFLMKASNSEIDANPWGLSSSSISLRYIPLAVGVPGNMSGAPGTPLIPIEALIASVVSALLYERYFL